MNSVPPVMPKIFFGNDNDNDNPTDELLEHMSSCANDDLENSVLNELTKLDNVLTKCASCDKGKF
jgi:hypothetical protein